MMKTEVLEGSERKGGAANMADTLPLLKASSDTFWKPRQPEAGSIFKKPHSSTLQSNR